MKTLQILDTDVIRRIFSYLPLSEKLKLTLLHPNFGAILMHTIHDETVSPLDIQTNFSLEEADYLLSTYGPFISRYEHILLPNRSAEEYFNLIRKYCTNIEEMTFTRTEITPDSRGGQLLQHSKQLKKLRLNGCTVRNAACSQLLAELSELQSLNLENSKITGKGLGKLTNLIELSLKNCHFYKGAHLIRLFQNNRLKRLNIRDFKQITNRILEVLMETQSAIEKLELGAKGRANDFERICTLPNLREVAMYNMSKVVAVDYLEALVVNKKDSLECLEVHFQSSLQIFWGLRRIVNPIFEFHNLRVLCIRNWDLFGYHDLGLLRKTCTRLEMLDLTGSFFNDNSIVHCLEYLKCLRYVDLSYCREITRNVYCRLVKARRERKYIHPLIVYIKPQMDITCILNNPESYIPEETKVWLSLDSMRTNVENGLLDLLSHLNIVHAPKNKVVLPKPPRLLLKDCLLLQTDDYCLYHILKYLNPLNKLNLLLASEKFADTVKYSLRSDVVNISSLMEAFSLSDARRLLQRHGSLIRRLHTGVWFDIAPQRLGYVDLIAEFCTNLIELNGNVIVAETDKLKQIFNASASTMRKFQMWGNWNDPDSFALEIAKARNLETLILHWRTFSGVYLDTLTNLAKLDISGCTMFENLAGICTSNRLTELNIENCRKLNNNSFRVLAETQKDLKRISLGGFYVATNMHALADLAGLEHIKLVDCFPQESIGFLAAFCEQRSNQIKSLVLQYKDDFLFATLQLQFRENIIEKMKNLRILSLHYVGLSDSFIKSIAEACSQLEILNIGLGRTVTETGLMLPLKILGELRHYNITWFEIEDGLVFYHEAVKIRKEKFPYGSIMLYLRHDFIIRAFIETKEYTVREKDIAMYEYMP